MVRMTKEDIASFVDLDRRRRVLELRQQLLQTELAGLATAVRGITREQDMWLTCFAARNDVLDLVGSLRFDLQQGVARVEDKD